jgi:carbamoyltransferase
MSSIFRTALCAVLILNFTIQPAYCEYLLAPRDLFTRPAADGIKQGAENVVTSDVKLIGILVAVADRFFTPTGSAIDGVSIGIDMRNRFRRDADIRHALDKIDFPAIHSENGILTVPVNRYGKYFNVLMSRGDDIAAGSGWSIIDKFGIKVESRDRPKSSAMSPGEKAAVLSGFRDEVRALLDKGASVLIFSDMDGTLTPPGEKGSPETVALVNSIAEHEVFSVVTGIGRDKLCRQMLALNEEEARRSGRHHALNNLVGGANNGSEIFMYDDKTQTFVLRSSLDLRQFLNNKYDKMIGVLRECIKDNKMPDMIRDIMGWSDFKGSPIDERPNSAHPSQVSIMVLGNTATTEDKRHFASAESDPTSPYYNVREKVYIPYLQNAFARLGVNIEARRSGLSSIDITVINKGLAIRRILTELKKMRKFVTGKGRPVAVIFMGDALGQDENDAPAIAVADIIINVGPEVPGLKNRLMRGRKSYFSLSDTGPEGVNDFLRAYLGTKFPDDTGAAPSKPRDIKGPNAPESNSIVRGLIKHDRIIEISLEGDVLKAHKVLYQERYVTGKTPPELYQGEEVPIASLFSEAEIANLAKWIREHPARGPPVKFRIALNEPALGWRNGIESSNIAHAGYNDQCIYLGHLFLKYLMSNGADREADCVEILEKDEIQHLLRSDNIEEVHSGAAYEARLARVDAIIRLLAVTKPDKHNEIKASLSILTASDDRVVSEVEEAKAAGITAIHVDYLDGKFTPGSEGPFDCTEQIRKISSLSIPIEVHLMVSEPTFELVERMIGAGLTPGKDSVAVHYESFKNKNDLEQFVKNIQKSGLEARIVINPETPLHALEDISGLLGKEVRGIVLMAIVPGAVSRPFIPTTLEKISQLRKLLYEKNIGNVEIETDGGISNDSLESVINSGVDVFVSRTWLLKSGRDLKEAVGKIKEVSAKAESQRSDLGLALGGYGVNISRFLSDAITEFCAGRDAFTTNDLVRYIKKMPGVTDVKIWRERVVDIYYGDKLVRFHKKDIVPIEYLGLEDRIYYRGVAVKIYKGNFVPDSKKRYVLGISGSWHDSTAVLLKDGKIVSALEEERMTRTKHDTSAFPINAIHELLRRENITLSDIGHIAIGWNYNIYVDTPHSRAPSDEFFAGMDEAFARKADVPEDKLTRRNVPEKNKERFNIKNLEAFLAELKSYYGTDYSPQVAFVRHHLAHAASAYYPSGFAGSTLVLTLDGYGDTETGSVWLGHAGNMEEVAHFELPNSLGWVWAAMTEYLNFRPTFSEGEIMGFAPYGEPRDEIERTRVERLRELFREYIYFDHRTGTFKTNPAYLYYGVIAPGKLRVTQALVEKLTALGIPPSKKNPREIDPLLAEDRPYANLAFVLQETTDELVADVISYYLQRNPKTKYLQKLAYGGGIALNILSNGRIISEGLIRGEDIFIQPAASDAGTAIGAALVAAKELYGINVSFEMTHAFYGPEYSDSDIEATLNGLGLVAGVDYRKLDDDELIEQAAQCIKNRQPIAWFQGRSELGPRALGSRSVLLNLLDDTANNTANIIKGRQPWRPSASSVEEDAARDYFIGIGKSPFMIIAFDVAADKKHLMASGVHQYGKRLARPQTVSEKANPLYWRLLKKVGELIGVPAVVNTSFNKQEPLVENPEEAINTFRYMKGVDTLFMGHYLIKKSSRMQPTIVSLQDEPTLKDLLREATSSGDINDWNRLFTGVSALYPKSHTIRVTFDCGDYGTREISIPLVKELFEGPSRSVVMRYVASVIYNHVIGFSAKKIYIGASSSKMDGPVFYLMRDYLRDNFKRMDYFANSGEKVQVLPLPAEGVALKEPARSKNIVSRPSEAQRQGIYIGIDVGANRIKGVVIKDGKLIRKEVLSTTFAGGRELRSLIMGMVEDLSGAEKISGVGISLPGVVDSVRNKVVWLVNYEYRWSEGGLRKEDDIRSYYEALDDMAGELSVKYGTDRVGMLNDATAFGFTELASGSGQKRVLMSIGTGVGTVRIEDGGIDIGRIEQSGGFVVNVSDDAPFDKGCSVKGCFASYVGIEGIMDIAGKLGLPGLLGKSAPSLQDINRLIGTDTGAGYAESKRLYSELSKRIASWLRLMISMRDDKDFIMTGGNTTGRAGHEIVFGIYGALKNGDMNIHISVPTSDLEREYGGAMGAAFFAMTRSEKSGTAGTPKPRDIKGPNAPSDDLQISEPLIGHGFKASEIDEGIEDGKMSLIPWRSSPEFVAAVDALERKLREDAPSVIPPFLYGPLIQKMLDKLEAFKSGKEGEETLRLGICQSRYYDPDHYYAGFGTSRNIGLGEEFFTPGDPLAGHAVEALFHELFHSVRSIDGDDDIENDTLSHFDAMRYQALLFWALTPDETSGIPVLKATELTSHNKNLFGNVMRAWKVKQSRIPDRMAHDEWKELLETLRYVLRSAKRGDRGLLKEFLENCETQTKDGDNWLYPIQARYPLLRAAALLTKREKSVLLKILIDPASSELQQLAVADSIVLMLCDILPGKTVNRIFKEWIEKQAPYLKGRRIWQVAAEIWYAGGGLGRVMQFHGVAMQEILSKAGVPLAHVEPRYFHDKQGSRIGEHALGIDDSIPGDHRIREVMRFNIRVGKDDALAVCYRAVNRLGIEMYLVEGFKAGQNPDKDIPYYTESLYNYRKYWNDPDGQHLVTREEFSIFLAFASVELIRRVEETSRSQDPSGWRAPVMHFNDGQLGFAPYFLKKRYANDPILKNALVADSTHTYFNRQFSVQKLGEETEEEKFLRECGISAQDEELYFHHRMDIWGDKGVTPFQPVADQTSAGLRCADWAGGVAEEHVHRLYMYAYDTFKSLRDRGINVEMFAVTNGDLRSETAKEFRQAMREVCGDKVDFEEPTPEQVFDAKVRSKERLGERCRIGINPHQFVISYTGRGVSEKSGGQRALTGHNIRELVKRGVQVVIGCNAQVEENILRSWEELEESMRQDKAREPDRYPGNFILIKDSTVEIQRYILAASDVQVQDSDPITEAAGNSEADILACAGLEIAPPWNEGNLQHQGIPFNPTNIGEGNIIVPEIIVSEEDYAGLRMPYNRRLNEMVEGAYLESFKMVFGLGRNPEETLRLLSQYGANAVRLSRVLEARLTAAEYLRQWNAAIARKEGIASWPAARSAEETKSGLTGSIRKGFEIIISIPEIFTTGITYKQFEDARRRVSSLSETTYRTELQMLERFGIIEVDRSGRVHRITAKSDLQSLSPPGRDAAIKDIAAIKELDKREIKDEKEIARIRSEVDAIVNMYRIHEIDIKLYPSVDNGKTIYRVIPLERIHASLRPQFAHMIYRLNNDHPELCEKIKLVAREDDMADAIRELAADPNNIVTAAMPNAESLKGLPVGVKALVFKGETGDLDGFKQVECILAALRALDRSDVGALRELYKLSTGEELAVSDQEILAALNDPQELARKIIFNLKPISIENREMRDRLNSRVLELIRQSA